VILSGDVASLHRRFRTVAGRRVVAMIMRRRRNNVRAMDGDGVEVGVG